MTNDKYWIALQNVMGYGNPRAFEILDHFADITEFFKADEKTVRGMKLLTPKELQNFKSVDFNAVEKVIDNCNKKGYKIITPDDEQYPACLLRIKNPPCVLYVMGELPQMDDEVGIAMVGTRNCTKNGLIVASVLGYRLAEAGAVIISGGALGIDTACSRGAVAAKKKSVIVLGCGLDYPNLLRNRKIWDDVAKNGAVISEYQPDVAPSHYTFPIRNRLMSALAKGVVLIEAPEKSGALITVSHALEQGKDIYVLPGDITNFNYVGNNKLLQDGANAIFTPRDVLNEYLSEYPHKLFLRNADIPLNEDRLFINLYNKNINVPEDRYLNRSKEYKPRKPDDKIRKTSVMKAAEPETVYEPKPFSLPKLQFDADETVAKIYNCFTNAPVSVDILIQNSNCSAQDVLYALTELEINGAVEALPGGLYKVCCE